MEKHQGLTRRVRKVTAARRAPQVGCCVQRPRSYRAAGGAEIRNLFVYGRTTNLDLKISFKKKKVNLNHNNNLMVSAS